MALTDATVVSEVSVELMSPEELAEEAAKLEELRKLIDRARDAVGRKRPPVKLSEVSKGSGGICDSAYRADVQRFMADNMDGLDITDLADEEGNHNFEEWEFEAGDDFRVKRIDYPVPCSVCGGDEEDRKDCTECEGKGSVETEDRYVIESDHSSNNFLDSGEVSNAYPDPDDTIEIGDEKDVACWLYDSDAERVAKELSLEHRRENGYGFPWAWNWSYRPESHIRTEDLISAGFVVASYRGTRYCGIDGGGYAFDGVHYAKLYAICAQRWGSLVETETGPRRIVVTGEEE